MEPLTRGCGGVDIAKLVKPNGVRSHMHLLRWFSKTIVKPLVHCRKSPQAHNRKEGQSRMKPVLLSKLYRLQCKWSWSWHWEMPVTLLIGFFVTSPLKTNESWLIPLYR